MVYWIIFIISGIFSFGCFFLAYQSYSLDQGGAFLFAGFGLIALIFFGISAGRFITGKKEEHRPVLFAPHWFMLGVIIVAVIAVLVAVLIPLFLK